MVVSPDEWHWSSHHYILDDAAPPYWLTRESLLSQFGATHDEAIPACCRFVAGGMREASPLARICHQILLGDEAFVSAHQQSQRSAAFRDTPRQQRRAVALSTANIKPSIATETMHWHAPIAAFTMSHIAAAFHVSNRAVSRAISTFNKCATCCRLSGAGPRSCTNARPDPGLPCEECI